MNDVTLTWYRLAQERIKLHSDALGKLHAAERALVTAREALEKYANEDNYTASWEPIDSGGAALTRGFEEDEPWAVAQQALTDIAAVLGTEER